MLRVCGQTLSLKGVKPFSQRFESRELIPTSFEWLYLRESKMAKIDEYSDNLNEIRSKKLIGIDPVGAALLRSYDFFTVQNESSNCVRHVAMHIMHESMKQFVGRRVGYEIDGKERESNCVGGAWRPEIGINKSAREWERLASRLAVSDFDSSL